MILYPLVREFSVGELRMPSHPLLISLRSAFGGVPISTLVSACPSVIITKKSPSC